jgi:hypothetical protein
LSTRSRATKPAKREGRRYLEQRACHVDDCYRRADRAFGSGSPDIAAAAPRGTDMSGKKLRLAISRSVSGRSPAVVFGQDLWLGCQSAEIPGRARRLTSHAINWQLKLLAVDRLYSFDHDGICAAQTWGITDGFNVVPIWIEHESCIVSVVVWPQTGPSIGTPAGFERQPVKRFDVFSRASLKRQVDSRHVIVGSIHIDFIDHKVVCPLPENALKMKRITDRAIEPPAGLEI